MVTKRFAIIGAVLTVLVAIDGIYMLVTKYKPDDVNNYSLSDGATVLIAAALLLIVTIVAFILAQRSQRQAASSETTPEARG